MPDGDESGRVRRFFRRFLPLAALCMTGPGAVASPGSVCPLDLEAVRPVLHEALEASGVSGPALAKYEDRFEVLAWDMAQRVGAGGSNRRVARRLHSALHRTIFRAYRDDADGIPDVFNTGDYNCVSSSLVEALLARALGVDVRIVPGPHHVFLRVRNGSSTIDVETTSPTGFNAHGDTDATVRLVLEYKLTSPSEVATRGARQVIDHAGAYGPEIPIEEAPAFVWYNSAGRALTAGDGRRAAALLAEGERRHPGVAAPRDALLGSFAQAFRLDYEAGRFDSAYQTAAIGVRLVPGSVSSRDRLLAAATQRLDALADSGCVDDAVAVVDDVRSLVGGFADRFERYALPTLVASAVRTGNWTGASALAARYAALALDAIESARLSAWVEARRRDAGASR